MRQVRPLAIGLALLTTALAVAAVPALDGSKVVEKRFDNGMRLVVKPEHRWGLVSVGLYIRAGSYCETDENAGVAHLLEHMLFESTERGNGQRLGPAVEAMGGDIGAHTTRDFTSLEATIASQFLPEVLPLLAKAVFDAEITPSAVALEREVVARELTDRSEYAEGSLDDMIWGTAFTVHPYRRPIGSTPSQVAGLTLEQVLAFRQRFYVPGNMALVVVGDVDVDALTAQVADLFGARPAVGYEPPQVLPEPPQDDIRTMVTTRPGDTVIFSYAWRAPAITDPVDVCAMDLIYTVLGEGVFGRLNHALQESGLALMSSVDFLTQRYPGLLMVTVLTTPAEDLKARSAVLAEIKRLREEPLTADELAEAKRLLGIDYAFNNEAYSDQVGSLGFYEAIDSWRFATGYIDSVNAVTAEDISRVAQQYLGLESYTLVVVRPQPRPGETEEA